jgi:hypothetical protein
MAAPPREVDGLAVDQHEIDFGVRHAQRLDGILDRRCAVERVAERPLASIKRQEVVQLLVEAELRLRHLAIASSSQHR